MDSEMLSGDGMDMDLDNPESLAQLQNMEFETLNFENMTSLDDVVKFMDSNFATFLLSLLCAISWIVYITFYSSRITGLLATKIINRIFKDGYINIGSLSFSVLSGKVMFRDVTYITEDCSYRVQDGWVIFRWWRTYVPKDISEDMSHSDTRLSILLNGFEYHLYNRSDFYSRLEKLFDLDAFIIPGGSKNLEKDADQGGKSHPKPPSAVGYSWRDLIPVIKLELSCGRVVFGNMLVPYTLALVVEEAHLIYTTKPAPSKLDHFMHIIKCKAENFKVLLSQSPKYTGLKDDPPRLMGEGFGIVTANKLEFYYYMDEPGVVPNEPEMLQLANGDLVEANPPIWGIDIKCGKGTDFSYGPWADRQREQLYKLFYPQDYQPLKPTSPPCAGELRQIQSFDIRLSTLTDATVDILFSRDQETNAIHMNVGPGSYLEVTIPWIVRSNGYMTKITGQLLHLEASTSLQYRNFLDSETLQFTVESHYPLHWNDHQDWTMNLTGCKASAYLIFAHKWFFQAMVNDWSSRTPPDLLSFVPYTWKIIFCLKEFEIMTATNEYNWIDCSSQNHENSLLAACGELFELSFDLPFFEFLPTTVLFKFWIQIEGGDLNFYVPEVSTAYIALDSLTKNAKVRNRDGSVTWNSSTTNNVNVQSSGRGSKVKKWRNICQTSEAWIECWSVPICAVSIAFNYHPMPPLGPSPQADVTTPEKEESLLSPMRIPGDKEMPKKVTSANLVYSDFDPLSLPPDHVHVECEVGPSVMLLYGALLKIVINLKENIFGDYQDFIDMEKIKCGTGNLFGFKIPAGSAGPGGDKIGSLDKIDPREYRPLEVTVSATLHDIRAHLLKNCKEDDPPCPTICVERFGFEMNKKFKETILQVLLSPVMLLVSDTVDRSESSDHHLKEGYLMLSGLQVRGHAMFSNDGRTLDQETLEYGWLVEVQLGKLSGRLTTPHVENIVSGCEAFLLTVLDGENSLRSPHPFLVCHHGNNQFECPIFHVEVSNNSFGTGEDLKSETFASSVRSPSFNEYDRESPKSLMAVCPTSEDIKYKLVRVSLDAIDIYLVESGSALSLWVSPIRFALCNLHGAFMKEGFSLLIPTIQLRHFVMVNPSFTKRFQFSDLNILQSSTETMTASWTSKVELNTSAPQSPTSTSANSWSYLWLEAGAVALGPLCIELAMKGSSQSLSLQNMFLIKHDKKTKRLWFLWKAEILKEVKVKEKETNNEKSVKKCGCIGGCAFFGSNIGGTRFFWPSRKDWIDGVNVACFRVNKPGEDYGFGQSILKPAVLVFDTPPYTTQQGVSILELPTEWTRDAPPKSGKAPYIFKPSLLADLSHTSSSIPSNRSDKMSTLGSTLQSNRGRRFSQPSQSGLKRQTRISDPLTQGSDSKLHDADLHHSLRVDDSIHVGRTSSCCSDSKLGVDYFQSFEEDVEEPSEIQKEHRPLKSHSVPGKSMEGTEEGTPANKKKWHGSITSLDSLSDLSFISALSVQEECMVNLQLHLNKPIVESSLLMPCYMSHLTQLKCDNWHVTAPAVASDSVGLAPFVQMQDGKLVYAGSKYTPYFDPLVDGFTTLAMVNMDNLGDTTKGTPSQSSSVNTPSQTHFWETPIGAVSSFSRVDNKREQSSDEEFYKTILCSDVDTVPTGVNTEATTIIVRTKNDINIMVSPMLLEALKKFIEAVTPTLSTLHPLTVVNHLHNDCISRVGKSNLLKKEKSVLLSKIQTSKRTTALRVEEASPEHSNVYEEVSQTAIQGSISLPKINVTLLQASVVEEVISFSALDNIRDLMCVSLLALAIEQTQIHFLFRNQVKKSVQVLHRPVILPKAQKKRKSKVSASDSLLSEPVFIENSEKQSELMSTSVDIHRIHGQLRRLKNDSSILKEAVITAIPNQHSKVLFRFAKIPSGLQEMKESTCSDSSRDNIASSSLGNIEEAIKNDKENLHGSHTATHNKCPDEKLGFIMFECGLEGISLKGVKNSEAAPKLDEKEETVSVTLCNEVYNHVERGSTPNVASTVETIASDKEITIMDTVDTKEEIEIIDVNAETPCKQSLGDTEASDFGENDREKSRVDKTSGAASVSCVIQFKVMWYNFAAPPQTPITRKIDYTRVDWNLVSTASTAINAWLNPIDQLTIAIVSMLKGHSKRTSGLLASLMAEALEIQSIHQPMRSKYSKLTSLAKTLQEDPSCQLCIILERYIRQTTSEKIESNVSDKRLPPLSTLRQGVIVLSRQWKNVLYTPLLLEHSLKSRKSKNFTVTFTLPHSEEESPGSDAEMSAEETTDERATLLDIEGGTASLQSMRFNRRSRGSSESTASEMSANNNNHKTLPSQPVLNSTRASDVYPLTENFNVNNLFSGDNNNRDKRAGSVGSVLTGNCSLSSAENENHAESGRSTPGAKRRNRSNIVRQISEWNANNEASTSAPRLSAMMSEQSHEESLLLGTHSKFPQHPSLMLLDAHVIFQPLLTSMGLMPHQIMGYSLDHLGSHMSIKASIDTMRIDIVESEVKGLGRGSLKGGKTPNSFVLNISPETPAFLCEKIGLEGDFQKSTDLSRDVLNKKSVIYLSRNYWKKQAKSAVIFSLNIDYISQQVNMPLLRLLHQITTMYQNVRETQMELREQRPSQNVEPNVVHKNSSSSGSDIPDQLGTGTSTQTKPVDISSTPTVEKESSASPNIAAMNNFNNTGTTSSSMKGSVIATRTQSFAQRFKTSAKAVKGSKLNIDGTLRTSSASQTPTSLRGPEFPESTPKPQQKIVESAITSQPNCWRTIYYLLDLYATRPETKTIINNRPQTLHDSTDGDHGRPARVPSTKLDGKDHLDDAEKGQSQEQHIPVPTIYITSSLEKQKDPPSEPPRFSIFVVARIQRTRLLASLSGLKLEAEIMNLQASCSYNKKMRPIAVDMSLTGHVGQAMIVLLEGIAPNQQTVVRVSIAKSGALYSGISRRTKDRNSGLLTIGPIHVDIPQHPVVLHGMMTRSTKQLSNTLQEFRVNRAASRISRGTTFDEVDFAAHLPHFQQHPVPVIVPEKNRKASDTTFFQPLHMQFSVTVDSLSITAALLPSLQAQYKMELVKSCGITGSKAKFQIHLPVHTLSFTTKLTSSEANLPSAASISLPHVDVSAEYIQDGKGPSDSHILDGVVLRHGSYLSASANIGSFEHCLTTDLLNHLVFVQKVFMKEVNEVVLKMSGGDKPVPLWEDEGASSLRSLLFTLAVRLQGIQITATTPTNTAVRLETGLLEFQMSNRVQGMSKSKHHANPTSTNNSSSSHPHVHSHHRHPTLNNKVFIKAQVDVNLSLGQLIRNVVFEEADSEYQQYAFFKTRIALRNALSEEISGADADKEVVLITLTRPLIYVQPVAVDKAILVWLNYKNAYEYWNEQRSSLNTEVLAAMPSQWQHSDKPHIPSLHEQSSTLFLQLTVDDMGISIPLNPSPHTWSGRVESENRGAVVLTLESTSISACSSGSLVSSGRFTGLCFRFSDDMVSMDDWKPNLHDPSVMNFCVVSEGTYEVCSKTTSQHQQTDNAKWFLNVKWQMEGVDMHVDVNVGKQLSALGHTLTTLAAFEEDDDDDTSERDNIFSTEDVPDYAGGVGTPGRSISQESVVLRRQKSTVGENLPSFLTDPSLGPRQKRSLLEKEMQERVSLIDELKKAGASPSQIEDERKKLQELENFAFRDFRRDWIKKLRRQSTRASSKFGLGSTKPLQMRSKSLAMPTPESEKKFDVGSPVESASPPSTESSPREGPSRSHSLRFKSKQRVTFGETQRQCSVDSANITTPDDDDEYVGVWLEDGATDNGSKSEGNEGKEFGGGHLTPGSSVSHKAQEPNVDLELDVKVFINSGKCVLHTKAKEEDPESRGRKRSERSGSGYDSLLHISSPVSSRKGRHNLSSSRIKSPFGSSAGQTDVTVFHIPGLDVKVHYDSHTLYEDRERDSLLSSLNRPTHERSDSGSSSGTLGGFNLGSGRKSGTKKASLFAWITLHSVPEETIISPHILDFLEQTLEPIPIPVSQKSFDGSSIQTDAASGVASTYYASFPVDVVVYFHMQPSTFRFSCQPISRVECMLRLPSLDVVFSSKRAEAEQDEFSNPNISSSSKSRSWRYSADLGGIKDKDSQQLAVGGLSVTGCLSDFSLYIFHPYGAAKKAGEWSPLSDNERKDSVSMNVEFVKLHLSRSRKIHVTGGSQNTGESRSFHQNNSENQQAAIRFSSIIDIGSASFKYDMRRLTEILAFPKAWYRRSIVRRLFLGDLSTTSMYDDEVGGDQSTYSGNSSPVFPPKCEDRRNSITFGISPAQKEKLRLNFESEHKRRGSKLDFFAGSKSSKSRSEDEGKEPASGISYWETLVLFTVNFTKLNVHMNMGNVMGNVNWLIRGAKSDGRISIGSTGHKNVYVSVGLDSSYIDAKGGIVAGTFELTQLNAFGRVKEDPGVEPHHNIGFKMYGVELRLDFMGTSVLMGRVSALEVTLKDEWHVRPIHRSQKDVALATYRPAMIFIHGDMAWDQLQLMISKSTTVDLLKMHCKLEEFFSQQFKSSKYVFSTLQVQESASLTPSMPRKAKKKLPEGGLWEELRHHRHWQEVLEKVSRMSISSMPISLPDSGTVLGGTMDLHGRNISLACFHGVNFKAKSWALFSLKEPFISFSTEAQETHSSDSGSVHVIQNLNFSLGQQNQHALTISSVQHESMAMVCRITRNVMFPPQFRTLHEWFHYAFAPSEIDDVQRFPSLEKERERVERERADSGGSERRTPARLHDPNHNREVIFALPSLELFFKTEHLQACKTPDSTGNRPVVECSFITEFGDHIFVTVDAEAFFFLHDLITSYVKEKEKLVFAQLAAGRSHSPSVRMEESDGQNPSSSVSPPAPRDMSSLGTGDGASSVSQLELEEAALQRDWRDYLCKTWQLEPTVRLLSWAGKSIEPYGVDYILHKLGFSHARITIPKWMQRGFCDPLDKVLSVLVFRMIDIARREKPPSTHRESGARH